MAYLLEKGADVNSSNMYGRTALSKSSWNGFEDIVRLLVSHPDIKIDQVDSQGRTALHVAVWGELGVRKKDTDVDKYLRNSDSVDCAKLLLDHGANPNHPDKYMVTPLGTACGTGSYNCIDLLVSYGADVNFRDNEGAPPLHRCFYRGYVECLKRLIKHKPDTMIVQEKFKVTAIECVFRDNMWKILEYVLND